ncbi:MAG: flavodoxin family protein [Alphaproteobacteria bacterium]|nr:flavodoxin family protein [Alphaproteobacteria bacterium]
MPKTIVVLQGHPHAAGKHLCHALADAYAAGAKAGGARIERIDIGAVDVALLANPADFASDPALPIRDAQDKIKRSDHLCVVYPLWLGTMPARVKAFFEQLSRNEFAIAESGHGWPKKMLKGRSARVVVTMGMPAAAYKLFFGAHGVRGFESGILGMAGFKPIRETLIGGVGELSEKRSASLIARLRALGERDAT